MLHCVCDKQCDVVKLACAFSVCLDFFSMMKIRTVYVK